MAVHTFSAAALLKCSMKWPPPAALRINACSANPAAGARACRRSPEFGGRASRRRGGGALGIQQIFGISSNPARSGCRFHAAAFAKGLNTETDAETPQVSVDTPRGGLPRFHVDALPAMKGTVVRVEGDEFWHMTRVLRLNVDDRVELFDGKGGLVEGTLLRVTNNCVEVAAVIGPRILPPAGPNWHVAAAFRRKFRNSATKYKTDLGEHVYFEGGARRLARGKMHGLRLCGELSGAVMVLTIPSKVPTAWKIHKELGAQSLTPLLTQRSAAVPGQRNDRWHRISMAATKQCQRLHTLDVREPTRLQALLPEVEKAEVAFLAAAGATPLVQALSKMPTRPGGGLLLIGPEGDFTPEEVKALIGAGAVPVGLGQRRLRVETAAIAILTTVMLMSDGYPADS